MAKYKQDDIVTLNVTDYGMDGEGIARFDDHVFFVPFALKGETVKAKITYVKKNLIFANLSEIVVSSPDRQKPICNRFGRCGGCGLMHMDYREQLALKRKNVETLLHKNAGIDVFVDEIVPSSNELFYRNKIQLPFGTVNGKVAVGFYRENSHKIVSITKCFLHGDWAEKLISVFLEYAEKFKLSAYNDVTKKGLLRHLVVRCIDEKYCIVVVTNNAPLPETAYLVRSITKAIGDNFSLYVSEKQEHNNIILGKSVKCIKNYDFIIDVLGIKVSLNPFSFLQLNNEIRDKIYMRIIDDILPKCATNNTATVIDAYAGVGILGSVLAKRGARVYNIEIVPEATADGNYLAANNGISSQVTNINGDAAIELPKLINALTSEQANNDTINLSVILDPPRKGCDASVLNVLNELTVPHKLYYISCNPATLTRDLKILSTSYEILSISPYDMFPNTKHIESLVCLTRK